MIYIRRISEVAKNQFDETLAIVRSMKNKSEWIRQEALLSPSKDLFFKYLDLSKRGEWNENAFQNIYVPQFLRELKSNKDAVDLLNSVYRNGRNKNIALCCFCIDENLCHRSIIAGLLQGAGAKVDAKDDYSRYFDMYKKL